MSLRHRLLALLGIQPRTEEGTSRKRGPAIHVVILDGTLSSIKPGDETNAGLAYKLLGEAGRHSNVSVYYEAGLQLREWRDLPAVLTGQGINQQISRAYGALASRFAEGDRIILIGFSRGAFAVRSLAGMIDRIGLLHQRHATERNVRQAFRLYQFGKKPAQKDRFHALYCHDETPIEAIAVWDTVKSLGIRLPVFVQLERAQFAFHSDGLVPSVKNAFQALARDERKEAFKPQIWRRPEGWTGHLEQVWFRGTHGDIGGQVGRRTMSRGLSNIPFVWLMGKLEDCGLPLPDGWRDRFPMDPTAPMISNWDGWGKLLLARKRRKVGSDPSERLHDSIAPAEPQS